MAEEFKKNVKLYISILKDEKERTKALSELRGHKRRLNEAIRAYMINQQLDEATIPDTATLTRVAKRRILSLKKPALEAWANDLMGGDERSLQEVGKLWDAREVKVVDQLQIQNPK